MAVFSTGSMPTCPEKKVQGLCHPLSLPPQSVSLTKRLLLTWEKVGHRGTTRPALSEEGWVPTFFPNEFWHFPQFGASSSLENWCIWRVLFGLQKTKCHPTFLPSLAPRARSESTCFLSTVLLVMLRILVSSCNACLFS